MAGTFPVWTRRVSPEGRLIMPDNEHSLAESFGAGLTKAGGWLKEYADEKADEASKSGDKQAVGRDDAFTVTLEDAPDHGLSITPDDSWNPNDLWPHGNWSRDDMGAEPHLDLLANQDARRHQYAAVNAVFSLAAASEAAQTKLQGAAPPGAPGFTEQVLATYDKLADEHLANTPPAMKPYVTAQIAVLRDRQLADATQFEVMARSDWDKQTGQDIYDNAIAQVSADPRQYEFAVANLDHAIKARGLSPVEQEALFGQVKDELGYAVMTGLVDRDPDEVERMIESGAADKYMAAGDRESWLQKVADRQDQRRVGEVKAWEQADNAAPGVHLALRQTAKQDLLQQLQRGTLSQDAINARKDVLGPELSADFGALVSHRASGTSDPAVVGELLIAAGSRDLWHEARNAMLQGRLSSSDLVRIVATNRDLINERVL